MSVAAPKPTWLPVDQAARDAAADARAMVLRRDATLNALSDVAAQFASVTAAADQVHATLQQQITDLTARVTALEARSLTGQVKRVVTGVSVALNATGTLSVTWDAPIAGPYVPLLISPVNVSVVTFSNVTSTGLTVSYKAGALISIGAVFNVVALRVG